jgi:hypothetical protein
MSRARQILDFVEGYETDPESQEQHDLNLQKGYTYQDKGKKDDQGDTKKKSGTKPSGMR